MLALLLRTDYRALSLALRWQRRKPDYPAPTDLD
jgi:hypothetical protein